MRRFSIIHRMMQEHPALVAEPSPTSPRASFEEAAFFGAEAATISGLTEKYQADLRFRGHITGKGRVRYDLFGLAALGIFATVGARTGPKAVAPLVKLASFGVAWNMLESPDCYEGDHLRTYCWDQATFARIEAWRAASALVRAPDIEPAAALEEIARIGPGDGFNWGMQARWLRGEIFRQRQGQN